MVFIAIQIRQPQEIEYCLGSFGLVIVGNVFGNVKVLVFDLRVVDTAFVVTTHHGRFVVVVHRLG